MTLIYCETLYIADDIEYNLHHMTLVHFSKGHKNNITMQTMNDVKCLRKDAITYSDKIQWDVCYDISMHKIRYKSEHN